MSRPGFYDFILSVPSNYHKHFSGERTKTKKYIWLDLSLRKLEGTRHFFPENPGHDNRQIIGKFFQFFLIFSEYINFTDSELLAEGIEMQNAVIQNILMYFLC